MIGGGGNIIKEIVISRMVLFRDVGWINLPNNPEIILMMYGKWKSLATKIIEEIRRRSIFRNVFNLN